MPSPEPSETPPASETPATGSGASSGGGSGGGGAAPAASVPIPEEAQAAVAAAAADLATRLGIDVGSLTVVEVTRMDWSDSSLGCPQPGILYAQVITPGYLIVLDSAGVKFDYHTALIGNVVLCNT